MAAVAEIAYGTPVNLTLGEAFVDLGIEHRNGEQVIRLAVDDGEGFLNLALSPELAELLADALLGLAHVSNCG
jgi:hypothetical protein